MQQVLTIQITPEELTNLIRQAVKEALPQPAPVKVEDPKGYENIADYLRLSKSTVQKLVKAKKLPIYRNGKPIFLNVAKYEESKRK